MPDNTDIPPRHSSRGPSGMTLGLSYVAVVLALVAAAYPFGDNPARAVVSGTGIAATAMILAQFVTSGRFQFISGRIGLDVTMGFHRAAAAGVLVFASLHVIALGFSGGMPGNVTRIAARLSHAIAAQGNRAGVAALVLLFAVYVLARWFRGRGVPYQYWRASHGATSVLVVILTLAHILNRHDTILAPLPGVLLLLLTVAAAVSLTIVYIVRPKRAYGHSFAVEKVRRLTDTVVELELQQAAPDLFSFVPGQFAWIATGGRHTVTDNPFSIASAPEELPVLRFMIREAGDATRAIISLRPGTPVAVDGPYGSFTEDRRAGVIVLVAGGIGMAPVLSILKSAAARHDNRPFILICAARSAADLAAREEIETLRSRLDLTVHFFVEDGLLPEGGHRGRLSKEVLLPLFAETDCGDALVFLCGPPPMMDTVTGALLDCGFPAGRVITERFDYDAAADPISRSVRRRFALVLAIIAAGVGCLAFLS